MLIFQSWHNTVFLNIILANIKSSLFVTSEDSLFGSCYFLYEKAEGSESTFSFDWQSVWEKDESGLKAKGW